MRRWTGVSLSRASTVRRKSTGGDDRHSADAAFAVLLAAAAAVAWGNRARNGSDGDQERRGRWLTPSPMPAPPGWRSGSSDNGGVGIGVLSRPACRCDNTSSGDASRRRGALPSLRSILLRRRTIRQMDRTKTHETLKSKYDVRWRRPLGEGAFGSVYRATDRSTSEGVALKKIDKSRTDADSFRREMDALIRLRSAGGHPHICALRENFDEGDYYYLVLDLVEGGEMFDQLIEHGAYSEADAARLVREVADAVAFLHGIGIVHADLKPENLMLSTKKASDAVVKVVDFGCAEILRNNDSGSGNIILPFDDDDDDNDDEMTEKETQNEGGRAGVGATPAYCPPESFADDTIIAHPSMDMWSLGVIVYIMLCGVHPFDPSGQSTDEQIEHRICGRGKKLPIKGSAITKHLSDSAIDLISKLMERDPSRRLTAEQMLEHPWVTGRTARTDVMAGSDERLKHFRIFRSKLEARFFRDAVRWSDEEDDEAGGGRGDAARKRAGLIERSFRSYDSGGRGFLTARDLAQATGNGEGTHGAHLTMSGYENLLSENMRPRFWPTGHVVYREGDLGNHMYFISSGTVEVTTMDGSRARRSQGDFFGEGALLHPRKIRSATVRCRTPCHVLEVSREYFEKFIASPETGGNLFVTLREKDKIRKRNRAKTILRLQNNMKGLDLQKGDYLYRGGDEGDALYILEKGVVDVDVQGHTVFTMKPGEFCGEHGLITGRKRNTSAVCVSDQCRVHQMMARDFYDLMDSSPTMKETLRDVCLRREFKKAVVFRTRKPFPSRKEIREAFDAADEDESGVIKLDEVKNLLRTMDPSISDDEIGDVVQSLDLSNSGNVTFEEFEAVFGATEKRSASI